MQGNDHDYSLNQSVSDSVEASAAVSANVQQPMPAGEAGKQSNFLVILLSILLIISCLTAGFFAFQTQKLVKDLTVLKISPTPTSEPESVSPMYTEPVATNIAVATTEPTPAMKVYTNAKYGFSFKYPADTKIMGDLNSLTYTLIRDNKVVTVMIGSNSQKSSINDYFLNQINSSDPQSINRYINFIDLKNGNNNFVFAAQDPIYFKSQTTGLTNYLISTGTNYVVNFNVANSSSLEPKESLINQIMSTYKVLN